MYRSSPFPSTLNTGYIKLWTCVALDPCKLWTPFGHFCPYFHTRYTLLCPKDEFTFTFRRGLIWKIDNPSTTLSLAPGIFDNPYKGAESASRVPQTTVDSSEIWRSPVEGGSLSHDLYIPGGCLGFPTSMVRGSRFSPKALEEEALGGFNLLPSTGPVATWMGRCLSSRLAWSTWVWRFDSSQVRIVFRPRVLPLFLLGESKADV